MPKTGAELLVESLVAAGVKSLFTLSGNQILSVYDATIGRDIALIHTRHEAAAVHGADAWGRLTEQPGVALVTAGPGHLNALSALYVALMAESPVVLLSGHCSLSQIGTGAFQEVDQIASAKTVTKAAWLAERAERLDEDIARALERACSGRPGPVHISLPVDVLEKDVSGRAALLRSQQVQREPHSPTLPLSQSPIPIDAICLLAEAQRPLILAGAAMSRPLRWADVQRLSDATNAPALPMESPRGVNDPWLRAATHCLSQADVVLLVGKKLDFSLRFGQPPAFSPQCRFIQIDDASSHVLQQLTTAAQEKKWEHDAWRREVDAARNAKPTEWESLSRSSQLPIHPLRVCAALQPFLDEDAIFVSDGGEFGQWMQAGLEAKCRIINGASGSIGGAIPMAMGAKCARPDQRVFVTVGDGAFGYHAMEFDTALRCNLPIIAVVGNDARWNAEHQLQIHAYGSERAVGCDLLPSRYDKVVEALGGHGEFVQRPDELTPALERAVASGRPACVNVMIEGAAAPTWR
jgi:acetolactate synthase-1/2/3 large subunit